jgi:pimeloyl-ACP methyl ester carboxylesterase
VGGPERCARELVVGARRLRGSYSVPREVGMLWTLWIACQDKEEAPPIDTETPSETETTPTDLDWKRCGSNWQCATLVREGGEIAVTRHLATLPSDRYVVVAEGGPGFSSIELAHILVDGGVLDEELSTTVNWVAMDNRGVGESDPVQCVSDSWMHEMRVLEPLPADEQQEAALQASRDAFQQGCLADRSSDELLQLGIETNLADLEALRQGLGVQTIDFLGLSYGTRLGALYASRYPEHTGRFVLDGLFGPVVTRDVVLGRQAEAFGVALQRFFERCDADPSCVLDDPQAAFERVLAALGTAPLPAPSDAEGRSLTRNEFRWAVFGLLYGPNDTALAQGLLEADAGDGSRMLSAADDSWSREPFSGEYAPWLQGYWAIGCLDMPWPDGWTDGDVWAFVASIEDAEPWLGSSNASGEFTCSGWPVSTPPPAISATTAPPLLLLNGRYDPATPWQNALDVQEALGNESILVSYEGDGHVAMFSDWSGCSYEAIREFLLEGTVSTSSCP